MKLDSKYFDTIRTKSKTEKAKEAATEGQCSWRGCEAKGDFPAPARAGKPQKYFFCLDHVKQYNKHYNYFGNLDKAEIAKHQREAATGERPTWKLGARHARDRSAPRIHDPFRVLDPLARARQKEAKPRVRSVMSTSRKSLDVLGLPEDASPEDIKAKFKSLAKSHHPDLNGGDRSGEVELKEYIKAYNILKKNGLC